MEGQSKPRRTAGRSATGSAPHLQRDPSQQRPRFLIGVDPGVKTGLAVWDRDKRSLVRVETLPALRAMEFVRSAASAGSGIELWFEDARQRNGYYGGMDAKQAKHGAGVREGVGSVKRDCSLWQEFCEMHKVPYLALKPAAGTTKLDRQEFAGFTKWIGVTSQHARDAAMLVFGG